MLTLTIEPVVLTESIGGALLDHLVPEKRSHTYCEHLHDQVRPTFFVTSAMAGAFFCADCVRSPFIADRVRAHDEDDTTCHVCLARPSRRRIQPMAVTAGRATLFGAICDRCLDSARSQGRPADGNMEQPVMLLTPRPD